MPFFSSQKTFEILTSHSFFNKKSGRNMSATGMRREDAGSESLPLGFTCDVALGAGPGVPRPCSIVRTQGGKEEMIRTDP